MIKDVIIDMKSSQGIDGETNSIELSTVGKYGFKDGSYFISYDESELLEMDDVKTTLYIHSDNTVVLHRTGSLQSRLVVQEGVRNNCFYNTPQGELIIGIFGEEVKHNLSSLGGDISMHYTIDSNLKLISHNVINISIKEVN